MRVRGRHRAQDRDGPCGQRVERDDGGVEPAPKKRVEVVAPVGRGHLDAAAREPVDGGLVAGGRLACERRAVAQTAQREGDLGRPGVAGAAARLGHVRIEEEHRLAVAGRAGRPRHPSRGRRHPAAGEIRPRRLAGGPHAQVDGLADPGLERGVGGGDRGELGGRDRRQMAHAVGAKWRALRRLLVAHRLDAVSERAQGHVALVDLVRLDAVPDACGGHVAPGAEPEPVDVGCGHELLAAEASALAGAELDVEPADGVQDARAARPSCRRTPRRGR